MSGYDHELNAVRKMALLFTRGISLSDDSDNTGFYQLLSYAIHTACDYAHLEVVITSHQSEPRRSSRKINSQEEPEDR